MDQTFFEAVNKRRNQYSINNLQAYYNQYNIR